MNWSAVRKRLQKQSFDLLAHGHGILILLVAGVVIFVTAFQFGESLATWSAEKYAAVVSSFIDNIAGRSFRQRLCLPGPIDIVYTWVNGSDPRLLEELRKYKQTMPNDLTVVQNVTSATICAFDNCAFANGVAVEPSLPAKISLRRIALLYPSFKNARLLTNVIDPVTGHNVSLVLFSTEEAALAVLSENVVIQQHTAQVRRLFYTTDKTLKNSVPSTNVAIMMGFPGELDKEQLFSALPTEHQNGIVHMELHRERGIAILSMSDDSSFISLLKSTNISISGKSPSLSEARFVWDLTDYRHNEDISASRFEDNDELRYSLRSVEQHAPWVRHIFIVTNGQIPSWLNLDDDRISIVTHSDIFANASHLPTFSSPAIESHLHRIHGLSEWFIYMNDDVLFGRDVWPDDFVTASGAQKVYLTWPVPNCRDGCPPSWISDGYCDRACNNSQCEWDGGDCEGSRGRAQHPLYAYSAADHGGHAVHTSELYCHQGCANNWIADRYCDQPCNVRDCGFDAADCGTANYYQLHRVDLQKHQQHYEATGTNIVYFNVSRLIGGESGSILSGSFSEDPAVRSASIARKFDVITVVLYHNQTERMLNFSLAVKDSTGANFTFNFTVTVDTCLVAKSDTTTQQVEHITTSMRSEFVEMFTFVASGSRKYAKPKYTVVTDLELLQSRLHGTISEDAVPLSAQTEYKQLLQQFANGELTETGYYSLLSFLLKKHSSLLNSTESKMHRQADQQVTARTGTKSQLSNKNLNFTRLKGDTMPDIPGIHVRKPGRQLNYYNNPVDDSHADGSDSLYTQEIVPDMHAGFLPWEKRDAVAGSRSLKRNSSDAYKTDNHAAQRHLLDTFADSLRHVSRIYNRAYGYTARRVPGHMPHMINRAIAGAMQKKFAEEWDLTSSHRIRHPDDMQFAFSYFYYLMSEPLNSSVAELFAEVDIDRSGVLSDRELRILATRMYELPLDIQTLEGLESVIINCSEYNRTQTDFTSSTASKPQEVYYEKRMPPVTLEVIAKCPAVMEAMQKQLKSRTKYEFEVLGEDEIMFKMLSENVSQVVAKLDEVRQKPRKFICLNDNIDYKSASAKTVKVVLRDFYESFLPKPSRFELSREYRNRFLHIDELREWWQYRRLLRIFAQCVFVGAVIFAVLSFCSDRMHSLRRRWLR